jgi:hypothetical protein
MDINTKPGKVVDKVHVYTTHGNPEDLKPYMALKHEVTNHLAPILRKLVNSYLPVKSMFQFLIFNYSQDQV